MKKIGKIKTWHLMPISLLLLIGVAVFIWLARGDFSTNKVTLKIEGPQQIENGKPHTFEVVVNNNSSKRLQDMNLRLDVPSSLQFEGHVQEIQSKFTTLDAGEEQREEFEIVPSSAKDTEEISARLGYSPEGISARFVSTTSFKMVIGQLDATVVLDLPKRVFSDQVIEGSVLIVPNSDIESSPVFLRLTTPEEFTMNETSHDFEFKQVWKLENLRKDTTVKRDFRGKLSRSTGNKKFKAELGKRDGVDFLPMNTVESSIEISESPIVLEHELSDKSQSVVSPGEKVEADISYTNKADVPLEDAVVKVFLPKDVVDFSSVEAEDAEVDSDEGTIEWNEAQASELRFTDVDEGGEFTYSFNLEDEIVPKNSDDKDKELELRAQITSDQENLELQGARLQAEDKLSLKLNSKLDFTQEVFRTGEDTGPHPPEEDESSTYTVRWRLSNTTNETKSSRVEAVLPEYASWEGTVDSSSENIKHISSSNTVVWDLGRLDVGTGHIRPEKEVEFRVEVTPDEFDIKQGVNVLEQSKATAIDTFTTTLLEETIFEEPVSE